MGILDKVSRETLHKIADSHLKLYGARIAAAWSGQRGIRLDECENLERLWKVEVSRISCDPEAAKPMSAAANNEYIDALWSGDYDDLLKPEELEAVRKWRA